MADAKGRGARSTKKSLPSGEHFPALRARSSTTAFRDNSTPVPKQRGGPPSLVRVSGIDHTGPVQGRTEGNRSLAKTTDGPEPSTADRARVPLFDWLNVGGVGDARGPVMGSGGPIEGPSQVSSYTRVPATSFRSVLTHINTRSVCTLGRHPPSPAVFVSSHFFPSLATLFFLGSALFFSSFWLFLVVALPLLLLSLLLTFQLVLFVRCPVVRSDVRFSILRRGFVVFPAGPRWDIPALPRTELSNSDS